ncbi:MAG TPA: anti-sigma factor antagonist [Candidatus Hydrogenedentes bacterium]|nr:anti-sigma factor antagonist [Candidatus Hydrogenedentota bacterium]
MALEIEQSERQGYWVIRVAGEVDLYTSPELRAAIVKSIPRIQCEAVAVDLSNVAYMDSSGVATLVEGLKMAHERKLRFHIAMPSAAVLKVLQLARLDSVFPILDILR